MVDRCPHCGWRREVNVCGCCGVWYCLDCWDIHVWEVEVAYEQKPGSGSLFPERERKTERHPNAKGSLVCPHCGTKLWLSSWTKTAEDGRKWVSISAQEPQKADDTPAKPAPVDLNDDIPF